MAEKPTPGRSIFANPLLRDSALVSNVIDLVDKQKQSTLAKGQPAKHAVPRDTRIKIKNSSGGDRVRGEVLDVGSMLLTNLDRRAKWFDGDTPDGTSLFAVLLQPLLDGQIGEAQLLGVCMARVNVSDTSHTHASSSSSSHVLASGTEGEARILYHTGSTGVQNCFVLLCCEGASDEWEVEDLEAESDITHTGAVQYGTASGDYTIDSAGNVVVDATSDITFKVGSTPTTVFQIDESAKTITLGTGSNAVALNWQNGVWQPAIGILGQVIPHQVAFDFNDFNGAALTVNFDTGINFPSKSTILGGYVEITTTFGGGGVGTASLDCGDSNDQSSLMQGQDVNAATGIFSLGSGGSGSINGSDGGTKTLPYTNDTGSSEDIDLELTCDINCSNLTQGAGVLTLYTIQR